ncbi:MAG: DUF3696 domain-containing protein [Dehalococcoidia bacterium]|nr:DUF3696 domain-containing protein [Dehalococcoidia bacterium]
MIKSVRFKNLRSIRDSKPLQLTDLNVFVGANNSGKSSILYGLLLLSMTLQDKDESMAMITATPEMDLGTYLDLVRGSRQDRKLSASIEFDKGVQLGALSFEKGSQASQVEGYASFTVEFEMDPQTMTPRVHSFSGQDERGKRLLAIRRKKDLSWHITGPAPHALEHLSVHLNNFVPYLVLHGPKPKEAIAGDAALRSIASRIQMSNLANRFSGMRYVAPVRERIHRYGNIGEMAHSELVPSGQNLLRILAAPSQRSPNDRTVIRELDYWLGRRFKLLKNVRLRDIDTANTLKSLVADDRHGNSAVNLAFMGCGISQLVPVIVQTVLLPKGGCLLVEQPEIHLHPKAQADLADLFIEQVKNGHGQYLVETHSEHFILRLRRRVAEGRIAPQKVRIFTVAKRGTATEITPHELNERGHFDAWPEGFFEEGFEEAMAIARAGRPSLVQEDDD